MRLQCMINDLLNFDKDNAKLRLTFDLLKVTNEYPYPSIYLSSIYFSLSEQRLLYYFKSPEGIPLYELVHNVINKKFSSSSSSTHICSSHDLAPIFRKVFRLTHMFYKEKTFKKQFKQFKKWVNL